MAKTRGRDVYSTKYGTRLNTQYDVHIFIVKGWHLVDLPVDDSRISPETLVLLARYNKIIYGIEFNSAFAVW
jgi:hypothetical protein